MNAFHSNRFPKLIVCIRSDQKWWTWEANPKWSWTVSEHNKQPQHNSWSTCVHETAGLLWNLKQITPKWIAIKPLWLPMISIHSQKLSKVAGCGMFVRSVPFDHFSDCSAWCHMRHTHECQNVNHHNYHDSPSHHALMTSKPIPHQLCI